MDDWKRIEIDELEVRLLVEIETFDRQDEDRWQKYRVPIRTAHLRRPGTSEVEPVFVVAATGDRALFFDDDEDEFGIARLAADDLLEDYGIYGELRSALQGLAQYD